MQQDLDKSFASSLMGFFPYSSANLVDMWNKIEIEQFAIGAKVQGNIHYAKHFSKKHFSVSWLVWFHTLNCNVLLKNIKHFLFAEVVVHPLRSLLI